MRISFLVHDAFGVGGTIRTVLNLAEALSERHSVEVVSVYRRWERPRFHISGRIRLLSLVDARKKSQDSLSSGATVRSQLVPPTEQYYGQYNGLTDDRISAYLARCSRDVVIATRPSLNLCLAQLGRSSTVRIAQEHMTYEMLPTELRRSLRVHYPGIDASVAVTEADADAFRSELAGTGARFLCIPNSVPAPSVPPTDGANKIAMAAGRLVDWKRFDLLINAFRRVVSKRPDWTLRIYGEGSEANGLRDLITELDLFNHVLLMGRVSPLEPEWSKAAIGVSSSDVEPFGMTLVEAMRCGLPMVATECRHGPPEIVRHGEDGLLTPVGDVEGLADALLTLIYDDDLRMRMGAAARRNAERYDPRTIVSRYESLFSDLLAAKAASTPGPRRAVSALRRAAAPRRIPTFKDIGPRSVARLLLGRARKAPMADCAIGASGALTVSLRPTRTGRAPRLLCRARDDQGPDVALLFQRNSAGAQQPSALTATVPLGLLREGRWDLYLQRRSGHVQRIRAGVRDLRGLLSHSPITANPPAAALTPYQTVHGNLTVRCWVRDPHFEVQTIRYGVDQLVLEGYFTGAEPSNPPELTVSRLHDPPASFVLHGETKGDASYSFTLPVRQMVDKRLLRVEDWGLYFVDQSGRRAVLARVLDDVAHKRVIFRFPTMTVREDMPPDLFDEGTSPQILITPNYAIDGNLNLTVSDLGG
jgi:glycosyltransferase involved in cell wall biosynthesis